jgi:hypothetical protein
MVQLAASLCGREAQFNKQEFGAAGRDRGGATLRKTSHGCNLFAMSQLGEKLGRFLWLEVNYRARAFLADSPFLFRRTPCSAATRKPKSVARNLDHLTDDGGYRLGRFEHYRLPEH